MGISALLSTFVKSSFKRFASALRTTISSLSVNSSWLLA
jgi:hypothetical protein